MKYIIFIILFCVNSYTFSQNILVTNSKNGEAIEGVMIYTEGFSGITDKNGMLDIPKQDEKTKVIFRHSSFITYKTSYKTLWAQNFKIQLVEDPVRLDEIVISANRRQQAKTEVPNKIISIEKADVELQNTQTAADMLATKGGIFIQKSQMGGGSPMIRGFSANRLLLVIDGIRMNNAIYRSGNLHNVISLDANTIDRTEVIFGPGSVIYGSDALGGVLHFQTIKPKLTTSQENEETGNFFTRYSSANFEKTFHGDFNYGSEKWGGVISLTYTDFGDQIMGSNGPDEYLRPNFVKPGSTGVDQLLINKNQERQKHSGYGQLNYMHKLRFRPSNKLEINYAYHFSKTSDIPRYDRLIQTSGDGLKYAEWYYGPQQWKLHSAEVSYNEKHLFFDKANIITAWQNYTESRNDRKFNKKELRQRKEDLNIFSLNLDLDKAIDQNNFLYYGLEANYNKVNSNGHSLNLTDNKKEVIASRYPDGSETNSIAAYTSYKLNLSNKFTLQAGARFTWTKLKGEFDLNFYDFPVKGFDSNHTSLTGNIGLVYHPTQDWQINLVAANGFRSPNIDDIAKVFDSEPGHVIVPNPDLNPEIAQNLELGILRHYKNLAKIELNLFYTYLKDAMVRRDFTLNGKDSIMYDCEMSKVEALVNADYAHIYGGSFSLDLVFSPKLRSKNSVTATFGEDSEGLAVRHAAPLFGTSHLIYNGYNKSFDFYINYNGEISYKNLAPSEREKPYMYAIDKNGNPYSPAWWTLNFKSSFKLNKHLTLNAGLENILNKRYRTYSSGIVSPGRNLVLSLKASI